MPTYSSKYYDPQKAHEYYEQHKKLKGRQSTASLNETGKNAVSYVKQQVNKERDDALETENKRFSKEAESEQKKYSDQIIEIVSLAKEKIDAIQLKYKRLNRAQKKILGPKIQAQLLKIKEENDKKRSEIEKVHSNSMETIYNKTASNRESITNKYENIYNQEVEKIGQDTSMQKTKSTKKTSTKKATKKSTTTKNKLSSVEQQIAEKRKQAREMTKKDQEKQKKKK